MAASEAVARGMRTMRDVAEAEVALTPSEVFDQALELLLPVRQQVNQGAVDFNFARKQLADGEQLLTQLPDTSQLRGDLQGVVTDLRQVGARCLKTWRTGATGGLINRRKIDRNAKSAIIGTIDKDSEPEEYAASRRQREGVTGWKPLPMEVPPKVAGESDARNWKLVSGNWKLGSYRRASRVRSVIAYRVAAEISSY